MGAMVESSARKASYLALACSGAIAVFVANYAWRMFHLSLFWETVLFWVAFIPMRIADGWALRRGYGLVLRAVIAVTLTALALLLTSVAGADICDEKLVSCRSRFP
ncbi:MAG: hypothetical protein ABIP64_03155 [Burkholderiales bacterium]